MLRWSLAGAMHEAYEQFAFSKATQHTLHLINTDLSAFYFECTKDRLFVPEVLLVSTFLLTFHFPFKDTWTSGPGTRGAQC